MRIERGGAGEIGWRCRVRGGGGSVEGGDGCAAGFGFCGWEGEKARRGGSGIVEIGGEINKGERDLNNLTNNKAFFFFFFAVWFRVI
jgi:hypothetical protein